MVKKVKTVRQLNEVRTYVLHDTGIVVRHIHIETPRRDLQYPEMTIQEGVQEEEFETIVEGAEKEIASIEKQKEAMFFIVDRISFEKYPIPRFIPRSLLAGADHADMLREIERCDHMLTKPTFEKLRAYLEEKREKNNH